MSRFEAAAFFSALLVLAVAVTHTVDVWLLDRDPSWLEAGSGDSIFEWMATATVGLCTAAAAVLAVMWRARRLTLVPLALALAIVFVADAFALTEKVGAAGDLLVAAVLGAVFVLLWRLSRDLEAGAPAIYLGLVLLAISVVIRAADPVFRELGWEHGDVAYEAKVVAKHGSELAGWVCIAIGIVPAALRFLARAPARGAQAEAGGNA